MLCRMPIRLTASKPTPERTEVLEKLLNFRENFHTTDKAFACWQQQDWTLRISSHCYRILINSTREDTDHNEWSECCLFCNIWCFWASTMFTWRSRLPNDSSLLPCLQQWHEEDHCTRYWYRCLSFSHCDCNRHGRLWTLVSFWPW